MITCLLNGDNVVEIGSEWPNAGLDIFEASEFCSCDAESSLNADSFSCSFERVDSAESCWDSR